MPPCGVAASLAGNSCCEIASNGTLMVTSFGIFLPARTCCATQKAKETAPGGFDSERDW